MTISIFYLQNSHGAIDRILEELAARGATISFQRSTHIHTQAVSHGVRCRPVLVPCRAVSFTDRTVSPKRLMISRHMQMQFPRCITVQLCQAYAAVTHKLVNVNIRQAHLIQIVPGVLASSLYGGHILNVAASPAPMMFLMCSRSST